MVSVLDILSQNYKIQKYQGQALVLIGLGDHKALGRARSDLGLSVQHLGSLGPSLHCWLTCC